MHNIKTIEDALDYALELQKKGYSKAEILNSLPAFRSELDDMLEITQMLHTYALKQPQPYEAPLRAFLRQMPIHIPALSRLKAYFRLPTLAPLASIALLLLVFIGQRFIIGSYFQSPNANVDAVLSALDKENNSELDANTTEDSATDAVLSEVLKSTDDVLLSATYNENQF